jgi:hypothetical protein
VDKVLFMKVQRVALELEIAVAGHGNSLAIVRGGRRDQLNQ